MAKRYVKSTRHTIQVDYLPFMDELAELNQCKPDIGEYFKKSQHVSNCQCVDELIFLTEFCCITGSLICIDYDLSTYIKINIFCHMFSFPGLSNV